MPQQQAQTMQQPQQFMPQNSPQNFEQPQNHIPVTEYFTSDNGDDLPF